MEKFDRNRQYKILETLLNSYPRVLPAEDSSEIYQMFSELDEYYANLLYLEAHGLILSGLTKKSMKIFHDQKGIFITAKGIDFIQHDGGLSAILNVQTIKFHREAAVVLEDLIAMSNLSDEQKDKAKSTLGEMSSETLKTVVQTITTAGLSALL
ncbi:hypothetical protein [Serratia liquefaciens]|uniref:hypothetical protein n=1 Tax=Serratia liquefaciens TaxID=614 RepID=UPI002360999F|nr:hypothetical protein [Serratia liquefaciens]